MHLEFENLNGIFKFLFFLVDGYECQNFLFLHMKLKP